MNRTRATLVTLLMLLSSIVLAPPAEAAVQYAPSSCFMTVNPWGGSASVKCDRGSYRIGVHCTWWSGGTTTRRSAWSVPAPQLAVAYCPFGSNITNAGAFWSDGRLIRFWK